MVADLIPVGMVCLGDAVFVYPATFKGQTIVHIRRYKKYGNKLYPTQEGVTLQPWWIPHIMQRSKVPQTTTDLRVGGFVPENHFLIESEDFQNFTFTRCKFSASGKCFTKSITITDEQWKRMMEQYEEISTAVADAFYGSVDFLAAYEKIHDLPIETKLPCSLDVSLGECYLAESFQNSFCKFMKINGVLKDPATFAEEQFGNREITFNTIALCQDLQGLVHCFYDELLEVPNFLALTPHSYLTRDFLKNVCLKSELQKSRKYFCPDNTFEYFEDYSQ